MLARKRLRSIDPQTQLPGIALTRNYDNRLRITGEKDTNSQQQTLYSYSLAGGYDGDSNVTGFSDSVMGTWSIHDDHLNRLYQGQATAGRYSGMNFISQYDSFGNRFAYGYWGTSSASVPPQQTLTYNANNQITAIDNENNGSVTYDAAGNMTSDGINQYLYDAENRLCAVKTPQGGTAYLYDGKGYRISKGTITSVSCDMTQNGYTPTNIYAVDLAGNQLEETDGTYNLLHGNVFLDGKVLATYSGSGLSQSNWHYSLNDWVGTKRVQASSTGTIDESCVSFPFGDGLNCQGTGADATEHHFTSKERDMESTLDYFPARYYTSNLGRFMSPDPLGGQLTNPQTLNRYAYAVNNPLTNGDPTGLYHCVWSESASGFDEDDTPENGGATQQQCTDQGGEAWVPDQGDLSAPSNTANFQIGVGGSNTGQQNSQSESSDSFDPNSAAGQLFGAQGAPYLIGANQLVTNTTIGYAAMYEGVLGGPAAFSGATNLAARGFGWYYGLTGGSGVVLGTYAENYLGAAQQIGANALNASQSVYRFFSNTDEWWTLNQGFLESSIFRGQQFYLNSEPMGTGGFYMEMRYLQSRGIDPFTLPRVLIPH